MLCDFCTVELSSGHSIYTATDFIVDGTEGLCRSKEDWYACEECARLINAEDMDALAIRAYDAMQEKPELPKGDVLAFLRSMYGQFQKHRNTEIAE